MSNGIASGVPPAAGGAGGAAGGGVCARADEPSAATAHAARIIETSARIISPPLKFLVVNTRLERRAGAVSAIGDAWRLQRSVRLLFRRADENFCARREVILAAGNIADHDGFRRHQQLFLAVLVFDR